MKNYTRVCVRIDLDAIEYNIEMMKANIQDGVKMLAVIKTDGYGHGAVQIARLLSTKEYIWGYAVATLEEAVILRHRGITKPILVLGCIFQDQRRSMIEHEIRMTVYTEEMAREVSDLAVSMGKNAYIHIKLDTGMSRLGFPTCQESVEHITNISRMPNLVMEGMFTHFAKADETDKSFTRKQMKEYCWMKDALTKEAVTFTYYHCSNSAGIIDLEETNMDLVRAGIATYGMYPSEEVVKENVPLKPAMELISHVAHVKWVKTGTPISYGGTFVTDKRTRVATIPVGYGDGYPRSLSNKGYVLIKGKKAPILGRVCMDQFMVDVTEIPEAAMGDRVTLIGREGQQEITMELLGELSGRFNYELACDITKRVPRVYTKGGEILYTKDYYQDF